MKLQQWILSHNNPRAWNQIPRSVLPTTTKRCLSSRHQYRPLQAVHDANIDHFRENHFNPEVPAIIRRPHFDHIPAFARWIEPTSNPSISRLNTEYLEKHGGDALVPLELTQTPPDTPSSETEKGSGYGFRQFQAPLSLFLQWMRAAETHPQSTRLYLAQCQLLDLPQVLRDDFPAPDLVAQAGRGDIYDTNVWIGHPPTYTPLHRDPNPNLFVQLAGRKVVRLLRPDDGQAVFRDVRRRIGKSGDRGAAVFRDDSMMQGEERTLLEWVVWGGGELGQGDSGEGEGEGYEAVLEAGDGVFIPKGWWHSIKGVGGGVTASVNWWFR